MIEVRLLGQQSVISGDGTEILSVSSQPKRLAVLVYLALSGASGDRFVSRDELLAVFWPESDQDHARNTLNQHLFRLRGSLGSDAILSRGADRLGVDHERLRCDAVEFDAAIKAGDRERALELYGGDLLPGFYVSGAPELEKWLDTRRLACRRQALEAAVALAGEEEGTSNWAEAVRWYRRATQIAPESEPAARGLASAIARVGESAAEPADFAEHAGPPPGEVPHPRDPSRPKPPEKLSAFGIQRAAFLVIAIAVLLFASGFLLRWRSPSPGLQATSLSRLAILPFANFMGDSAQDYLVEGLHDAVIGELSRTGNLVVKPYSSVITYKNSAKGLQEIARELGVDAIVEASMRRVGDSIQIQVRLLEPSTEEIVWTDAYADALPRVLSLINQVPSSISGGIMAALNPEAEIALSSPRPVDPAAHDAYLRAKYHSRTSNPAGLGLATDYFKKAIEIDSTYAEAWAGLGGILAHRGAWFGDLSPVWAMPEARNALEKALRLDSTLAEAHAGLATIKFYYFWDWPGAEADFKRSLQMNPNSADFHHGYGHFLRAMRRVEEGVVHLEQSVAIDPLNSWNWAELSMSYTHLGQFEEARDAVSQAVELDPESPGTRFVLALQMFGEGDSEEAAQVLKSIELTAFAAQIYASTGERVRAREYLDRLEAMSKRNHLSIAATHFALGDTAAALDWLERGLDTRDSNMVWVDFAANGDADGYYPLAEGWPWMNLSSHPRFQALREKMNFPRRPAASP